MNLSWLEGCTYTVHSGRVCLRVRVLNACGCGCECWFLVFLRRYFPVGSLSRRELSGGERSLGVQVAVESSVAVAVIAQTSYLLKIPHSRTRVGHPYEKRKL